MVQEGMLFVFGLRTIPYNIVWQLQNAIIGYFIHQNLNLSFCLDISIYFLNSLKISFSKRCGFFDK